MDASPPPKLTLWIDGQEDNDGGNQIRLSLSKQIILTQDYNGVDFECKAVHSGPARTISSGIKSYSVTCKSVCTNVHVYIMI